MQSCDLGLVNMGLVAEDKNCIQAGAKWDKNILFLHRESQIWDNLI